METSTPRGALRAARMAEEVYVAVEEGVMPAAERNWGAVSVEPWVRRGDGKGEAQREGSVQSSYPEF